MPSDSNADDYRHWINRERRLRRKILQNGPLIRESPVFRVCQDCAEICLCHEDRCPNCNSGNIQRELLTQYQDGIPESRIRCEFRFKNLRSEQISAFGSADQPLL
jgi:hypothetical protein